MIRLLACAGLALALGTVSVDAQVPAEDIVTLAPSASVSMDPLGACPSQVWTHLDQVINPNASRSPFVIPAGSVFVLTGANWAHNGHAGSALRIRIRNVVTEDLELVATVPTHSNLFGTLNAGALMFNPGVVVGHDTAICANLSAATGFGGGDAGLEVRVYGYLAKSNKIKAGPVVIGR